MKKKETKENCYYLLKQNARQTKVIKTPYMSPCLTIRVEALSDNGSESPICTTYILCSTDTIVKWCFTVMQNTTSPPRRW